MFMTKKKVRRLLEDLESAHRQALEEQRKKFQEEVERRVSEALQSQRESYQRDRIALEAQRKQFEEEVERWVARSLLEEKQKLEESRKALEEKKGKLEEEIERRVTKAMLDERRALEEKYAELFMEEAEAEADLTFADYVAAVETQYAQKALEILTEAFNRADYDDTTGWTATIQQDPREHTSEKVWRLQDAAYEKVKKNPHARAFANNVKWYTVGRGIRFDCEVQEVEDRLRRFWDKNRMDLRLKNIVWGLAVEGEYFLAYFINFKTGNVIVRKVRPKQITDIETHPDDIETRLAYLRSFTYQGETAEWWYPDIFYFRQLEDDNNGVRSEHEAEFVKTAVRGDIRLQFMKYGPEDELRGWVPLEPVLKDLKYYEDLRLDMVRRAHELAKVIWIKKIRGRTTAATKRERRAPKGGIMLVENEGVEYRTESPTLAAGDMSKIARVVLLSIGAGVTVPEHILNQDASNENYSSIKKADTPFTQMITDNQDLMRIWIEDMFRVVLEANIKSAANPLPSVVRIRRYAQEALFDVVDLVLDAVLEGEKTHDIVEAARRILEGAEEAVEVPTIEVPITITFPDIVHEDPLKQAQVLQIWAQLGVSPQTIFSRAGLDWRAELARRKMIRDMEREEEREALERFNQGLTPFYPE